MLKVLILQGIQASGKSTYARKLMEREPGRWKRVNRDSLRAMIDNNSWRGGKTEEFIKRIEEQIIYEALWDSYDLIVDDMNLSTKTCEWLEELVSAYNNDNTEEDYKAEIKYKFFDVSVGEAIRRDKLRDKKVGGKVIKDTYGKYLSKIREEREKNYIKQDPRLPHIILADIDGTLALNNGHRSFYDYSKVIDDKPNKPIVDLLSRFNRLIIFFSGREDSCRDETVGWLLGNVKRYPYLLYMRKTGDHRPDYIVKKEMFFEYIKDKYHVDYVLDDRKQVIEMYRSLGLTVLDVAGNDF